jgi:zinc and cadmium transporter
LSSLATLPGAVIAYFFLGATQKAVPFILAISAASFIYIAVADLVPDLHRQIGLKPALIQFFLLLAGIATIAMFRLVQ